MKLNINIHVMGMPFNGDTIKTKSLGGSESAGYYLARELAARGHRVCVWTTDREGEGIYDDVRYVWIGDASAEHPLGERFDHYATQTPHDVLVIQRHPLAFARKYAAKLCIWQHHDLALHRSAGTINDQMWNVDALTVVSEWHKAQLLQVYGLKPEIVRVIRNAVDPVLYATRRESPVELDSNKLNLLYQSRPERGLENLVRPGGIMSMLAEENVSAHLYACTYDNFPEHMRGHYDQLAQWASLLPNVTMVRPLSKPELAALQQNCDMLVYPTTFEEVSCITAIEAMHAGLPMLTTSAGALPETCEASGTMFVPWATSDKPDEHAVDIEKFARNIATFATDRGLLDYHNRRQYEAAQSRTWSRVADDFEALVEDLFLKTIPSPGAVLRNAIEHSDIGFAKWYGDTQVSAFDEGDRILAAALREVDQMYEFAHSPEAYKAHYDEHQTRYYDSFEERVIGEDVTGTTRFRGTLSALARYVNENRGRDLRILDYGCAHGHYIVPLAKLFPMFDFVGIDISARAIAAANKWVQREGLTNVTLIQSNQDILDSFEDGEFDVVLACEVVEHVWDYRALLTQFSRLAGAAGAVITTTPIGRWEWTGTAEFKKAREHVHHFDREDWREVWADVPDNEYEIVTAPASHDRTGAALGSYVVYARPGGCIPRAVDYQRKLGEYVPRQTVSACLIVKDGERTLRKCLDSFVDWVDEVIIGIDPSTSDHTLAVVHLFIADNPLKAIHYFDLSGPATQIGFGPARNETLNAASGDWIFWCDADEEVREPWNFWSRLKHSGADGFGLPQVHYSAQPEQVLTTDFPTRLFRNTGKVQFYGFVHEHPEVQKGKAIPHTLLFHGVKLLHSGYVDEGTRRARYHRNLPLLLRDRKEHPDRTLNGFLMLRDIAQGIVFDSERCGGAVLPHHVEQAMEGIKLYEQLLETSHLRLLMDSLQYYSQLVHVTGQGFEAQISYAVNHATAPQLAMRTELKGRFLNVEHFNKVFAKLVQESTKHYGSKYL